MSFMNWLNKKTGWLVVSLLLVMCSDKEPEILNTKKMTQVLLDMHIGEAKISQLNLTRDSSITIMGMYEKKIFEKYAIDSALYYRSYFHYVGNPEKLDEIYETIVDSLALRQQILNRK